MAAERAGVRLRTAPPGGYRMAPVLAAVNRIGVLGVISLVFTLTGGQVSGITGSTRPT